MKKSTGRPNKIKTENPARIVLIEDNPTDVYFMRLALDEQPGAYTLHVLHDGAEALRFVREQRAVAAVDPEPCVIVLDLHLPKHDGTEVLRAIKQEPLLSHVQVVVLTSVTRPQDEIKVRQLGVRLYRHKPSDLDEFAQLARNILEICQERSAVPASTAP
jgi:two-component system, chemotaxis family, response regulator Rcp1